MESLADDSCSTPLNKIAEPEEVARQIAFLASHRVAGHTTGQVIMIHGGMEGEFLVVTFGSVLIRVGPCREVVESKAVNEEDSVGSGRRRESCCDRGQNRWETAWRGSFLLGCMLSMLVYKFNPVLVPYHHIRRLLDSSRGVNNANIDGAHLWHAYMLKGMVTC